MIRKKMISNLDLEIAVDLVALLGLRRTHTPNIFVTENLFVHRLIDA